MWWNVVKEGPSKEMTVEQGPKCYKDASHSKGPGKRKSWQDKERG